MYGVYQGDPQFGPMMQRDASLSDSYTSDRCCFSQSVISLINSREGEINTSPQFEGERRGGGVDGDVIKQRIYCPQTSAGELQSDFPRVLTIGGTFSSYLS